MSSECQEIMNRVASIILAGGQGTRLLPLTQFRCKPAVCFGGRYRLIDIPISNSINAHIQQIFILSQYFASSLNQHVLETYPPEYFRESKIQMLTPQETELGKNWFKGTADAVRQNMQFLEIAPVDYFLILSGDQLYNINFTEMLKFAIKQDADLMIASIPVEEEEAKRLGLLKIDFSYKIQAFAEKPTDKQILKNFEMPEHSLNGHHLLHPKKTHYLASMGIYIFKKEALFDLLREEGNDFGKELIPIQIKKGKSISYVYKGYWEDIGTILSYYNAHMALLAHENCLETYDLNNPIFSHSHNLPSSFIKDTQIQSSMLSQGCVIEAKEITNSIIGVGAKIDQGTIVRDSIVLGSFIGKNCLIEKAILDEGSSIGNDVRLTNTNKLQTFDGDGIFIRDGIIIVTSKTKIDDNFNLGI